ncbi:hypothetical protein CSB95_7205 [Pseudomonas aeruginosa]|nr:hypothetical protein CSB95_7205 [Pseudomonas aeruginosa]
MTTCSARDAQTSNYSDFISQDRRLVILRILAEMPTYQANSSVLHTVLTSGT